MPSAARRLHKPTTTVSAPISVIIPVWQEGPGMADTVDHVVAVWGDAPLDLIAVDGDPDGTSIRHIPDAAPCRSAIGPRGRGPQMNHGAAMARGDILLFLHADTRLPDDAAALILDAMRSADVAGGAFDLAIAGPHPAFRLIEKTASLRSRLTRIPFGDQGIFVRRRIFERIGGYPAIPLFEDVALMQRLRRDRRRISFIPAPHRVHTSARRWQATGLLRNTLRNWALQLGYRLGVSPTLLAKYYR